MRNVRIECVKWPSMVINGSKTKGKTTFFDFFWKKTEKGLRVSKNTSTFASLLKRNTYNKHWKGGRVVDYSGLENRRAERHRGFESLPFRSESPARYWLSILQDFFVPKKMHQKCTKPRCYALLRVFLEFQISHTIYLIFSLWLAARNVMCIFSAISRKKMHEKREPPL